MRPCPKTYYSSKKVLGEAFQQWCYTRESWAPASPNSLDLHQQQDRQLPIKARCSRNLAEAISMIVLD